MSTAAIDAGLRALRQARSEPGAATVAAVAAAVLRQLAADEKDPENADLARAYAEQLERAAQG